MCCLTLPRNWLQKWGWRLISDPNIIVSKILLFGDGLHPPQVYDSEEREQPDTPRVIAADGKRCLRREARLEAQPRGAQHGESARSGTPAGSVSGASPAGSRRKSGSLSGTPVDCLHGAPSVDFCRIFSDLLCSYEFFGLHVCLCIIFIPRALGDQEMRSDPPRNGVTSGYTPQCGCWDPT